MAEKMLKFIKVERSMPSKRDASDRKDDFNEIYSEFSRDKAGEQAARCSQCGVPFCQQGCPLSNNIPDWLKLAAEDRLEEAYQVSSATNNMPEICGRICPQDRLCEGICTIEQSGHGTVTIGSIEKYITDNAWDQGWVKPITPPRERAQSAGIIGAGPAGLAAAEQLRRKGYQVTVYDAYDRGGGLLVYGIPGFKLEKDVVMRRIDRLVEGGIQFHLGFAVGEDATLDELRQKHDAILVATGVYKAREINVPGKDAEGVIAALDYLIASNRKSFGDEVPAFDDGRLDAKGKHVVVIGGGDTGSDCVGTSNRQGAASVTQLEIMPKPPEKEDKALTWPDWPLKLRTSSSHEEGVERDWAVLTKRVVGDGEKVTGLECARVEWVDGEMREIVGSEFTLQADLILLAMGFVGPKKAGLLEQAGVELTDRGNVSADTENYATSVENVFTCGDMRRGQSLVVWAIREGRQCARAVDEALMGASELPR